MAKANKKQSNLLKYWLTLEFLQPAGLPDRSIRLNRQSTFDLARHKDTRSIYLAVFNSTEAFNFLRTHFNSADKQPNEPDSEYVTATFQVNDKGQYVTSTQKELTIIKVCAVTRSLNTNFLSQIGEGAS